MTTTILEVEERIIAKLSGELDTAAVPETEAALQPVFNSSGKDIVLDCSELEYISSSGLRLLLSVLKRAQASGAHVILKDVSDVVRDVLDISGFASIFDIE